MIQAILNELCKSAARKFLRLYRILQGIWAKIARVAYILRHGGPIPGWDFHFGGQCDSCDYGNFLSYHLGSKYQCTACGTDREYNFSDKEIADRRRRCRRSLWRFTYWEQNET